MHKPSTLWPPPSEEVTRGFHTSIRDRIRKVIPSEALGQPIKFASVVEKVTEGHGRPQEAGDSLSVDEEGASTPDASSANCQLVELATEDGEVLKIQTQVQFYAPNNLLSHPLISPVLSHLGGLPPLLIIVGDGEVLRDEGIYL